MLRIHHSTNSKNAAQYFEDGLLLGDYLSTGEKTIGTWGGKSADMLGLSGQVKKEDFVALCQNKNPIDGSKLTQRNHPKRRVLYDFTFSLNKSTSILYAQTGDEKIMEAFNDSIKEVMTEIEKGMRTQKGQGKEKHYPLTGNIIYSKFVHMTTRPVDGIADPHIHAHCTVFNATWNEEKNRYQAGEFSVLKRQAPFYEAYFNSIMAKRLSDLGYGVDRRGYSWEVTGIEPSTISKFSRRTTQIEELAKAEEKKKGHISAKQKDKLGALSRAKKVAGESWENLKKIWRSWLTKDEAFKIDNAKELGAADKKKKEISAREAVNSSINHLLERKSVAFQYQILTDAMKKSFGELRPEDIKGAMKEQTFYREERNYMTLLTTEKAVQEEERMLAYVREGKGSKDAINPSYEPKANFLNEEQKRAVRHALNDTNSVMIVSGGAGVGKTTLVKEIRDGIEEKGIAFMGFAPSAAASRGVMRKEGFDKADTLASLLVNPKVQDQTKNAVIWIDEAGLIGNKDMNALFEIAKKQNARILLTGDVRQHNSVSAGDSLRILEENGGINVARVNKIQRQRNNPMFKHVVSLTSKGEIDTALLHLDRMGGVIETEDRSKREQLLIQDTLTKDKYSKLIIVIMMELVELG